MDSIGLEIIDAGRELADATAREMEMEQGKPMAKHAAILHTVGTPNELTGKPHSASSAEAVAEGDFGYASYLEEYREAVVEKIMARARYDAAVICGRLAAAMAGASVE